MVETVAVVRERPVIRLNRRIASLIARVALSGVQKTALSVRCASRASRAVSEVVAKGIGLRAFYVRRCRWTAGLAAAGGEVEREEAGLAAA